MRGWYRFAVSSCFGSVKRFLLILGVRRAYNNTCQVNAMWHNELTLISVVFVMFTISGVFFTSSTAEAQDVFMSDNPLYAFRRCGLASVANDAVKHATH